MARVHASPPFDRYLMIPFASQGRDHRGCDCWGLLRLIYRERLGIDLTAYAETPATSLRDVARLIRRHRTEWRRVETPQLFDAVIMRVIGGEHSGLDAHVGMAIDGSRLLHTEKLTGPRVEPIDAPTMKNRIVEFRRHHDLCHL